MLTVGYVYTTPHVQRSHCPMRLSLCEMLTASPVDILISMFTHVCQFHGQILLVSEKQTAVIIYHHVYVLYLIKFYILLCVQRIIESVDSRSRDGPDMPYYNYVIHYKNILTQRNLNCKIFLTFIFMIYTTMPIYQAPTIHRNDQVQNSNLSSFLSVFQG